MEEESSWSLVGEGEGECWSSCGRPEEGEGDEESWSSSGVVAEEESRSRKE